MWVCPSQKGWISPWFGTDHPQFSVQGDTQQEFHPAPNVSADFYPVPAQGIQRRCSSVSLGLEDNLGEVGADSEHPNPSIGSGEVFSFSVHLPGTCQSNCLSNLSPSAHPEPYGCYGIVNLTQRCVCLCKGLNNEH